MKIDRISADVIVLPRISVPAMRPYPAIPPRDPPGDAVLSQDSHPSPLGLISAWAWFCGGVVGLGVNSAAWVCCYGAG